jgi:DNA invertase Pin-like site-specific DNA recombinase
MFNKKYFNLLYVKGFYMSKIFTYIRKNQNNDKYTQEQKESIQKYIDKQNIQVFKNIEINISTPNEEKNILELLQNCEKNSTIIVSNLNVFGRTIETILEIVKFLLSNKIRILVVEQNLDLLDDKDMLTQMILGVISMTVSLEKELMSLRTKEALTAKKLNGMALGKPKGTIQKSKFDLQRDKIEELLAVGLSVRKISKLLGYNNHIGLNNYVKKRKIKANLNKPKEI